MNFCDGPSKILQDLSGKISPDISSIICSDIIEMQDRGSRILHDLSDEIS